VKIVNNHKFGTIRSALWPVRGYELKKLLPLLGMFFLLAFNYNVLRNMKDTLVITAPDSGAEVIPFIKVWVMFPMAILLTILFARLSSRLSRENVFYSVIGLFLLFFGLFTFVFYPHRDSIHFDSGANWLSTVLPAGASGFICMVRYWSFSIFYAMSELWGNIVLFVLFWGFANQITKVEEAKRFYAIIALGANIAGVCAGQMSIYIGSLEFNPNLPFGTNSWEQSMTLLTSMVLISGLGALALFRWVNTNVLTDPKFYDQAHHEETKNNRSQMGMRESIKGLINSRYLRNIAAIVICYNLVINLVEVVWKHQVRALYPDPNDFNIYMNEVTTWTGVLSTFIAVFASGNLIRKLGWTFTAVLTPVVLLVTSIGFFSFLFFQESWSLWTETFFSMTPLAIVVLFGSIQNVLSRSAKYSLFDSTKELAFVPLSPSEKLKGKAIIDGIIIRLGKSGGSLIHQSLLLVFTTLTASAPYVAGILFAAIGLWISSTLSLGHQFNQAVSRQQPKQEPDTLEEIENPLLQKI
jgi:AAA family ATP:ADP antiporter